MISKRAAVGLFFVSIMTAGFPARAADEESLSQFTRKQEVSLEAFCRDFYESNIMNPVIQERLEAGAIFVEVIKKELVEVDPKLLSINENKLAAEVVLLRLEIFGLAWAHHFNERLAVAQSVFTKNYLHEKGRDDIWDNMEFYNQAIARSSTLNRKTSNGLDRGYLAKVNTTRMDLFTKFNNEGFDPNAIARALNRLFTKDAWKQDTTAALLMMGVYERLGFGPNNKVWANKDAQFRLKGVIHGLYDGALQTIEDLKIVDK